MYVLETHRLSVVKDKDLSVYEVPETDFVYNLYYNLDPKDTHLTLSYISSSPDFPPDSLGYLYFEKKNGEWNNSYSFTRKLLDHDQLLSSTQPSTPPTPAIPLNTNEFVYDMSKDKDSTVNFELRVETIRGVKLATVLPRAHKKLVHLVDSQVMVWSSGPDDKCYRVLYAPFDEPKATAVVYSASGQQTVKYFMKSPDGSWNETSPDDFTRVLIPEVVSKKVATKVSLDFSNLATKVLRPLQKEILKSLRNLMSKPGSKFVEEHLMSFMFYPVPKELVVTDLYDGDDLVYSSHIENVNALQFYATKNDLYLRVTTDFLDHKTSHYFYTTLKLENQQQNLPKQPTDTLPSPTTNSLQTKSNTEPVGCDKFTFDLSASNKTNKYFTLQHLTYLGHEQVYVKVHSDYLLSRVVDGETVVWEQKGHVYLVNFGYMPEKNPSHLCLGLYCSKGHKLWYTFYYKKGGKWHLYTHDDKVPDALLKLSESLDSKTFFAFDLSSHSMSTDDYEIKEYEHLGQKYRIVNLHNLRVLFDIRDDKEIIWRFKNKKFALVFSYLPPENPNHLVVTCFTQNNLVHETFEKIDGKWILTDDDTTLRPQFSSQLIQSNLQYTTSPSAPVRCEKFTFDLTVHHESNDAFDLVRLTYLGHRQVYVKVHYDHVLTTLFDGKTVVWEQKGTVFLNNFGYLPEKNPSHLCLGLHCTKSHNLRHTFYYKKNGSWHLYSDDKDVPKELLELSNNLVSHFDFDMLSYSVFSSNYELKVLYILDQAVVWVKVHPGSFLDSVVDGNLSVWVNDGKKQVVLFSFYSPEKPQYFVIMYVDDLGTMHTDYYFKDNGRWVPLTSSEDKVLENALLQNSEDFSNLPPPSDNSLPTTSTSLTVGCEKFTYDLSVHHESSDAFDLFHLTQLGHEQVYVKVHSDYVLTTLFDGKTVVWEQKGHVYLANFGYLPENKPSHLCLGLYCSKGHKLWYTFYYKRDGKWQLYRHDDRVPDQLLELSKTLLLDHVSSFLDKRPHSQNEKLTPVLVRGEWQKIDKEEFYNNFLHVSVLREYATFDLKLLPDVGQYETKEGFEFGHPIRISNPMPDIHVGLILDGNEPVWKSNSVNEHVKSILTVHENEYKHLFSSTVRLIQLYIKDRDTISVKYFKRSQDDKWSEIIEKDYVSLYDNICKDFRSRKEFQSVDSESDKVDSDAETAASSTHLCPSPEDLLVTLSYADKESGSETTSQLKLNNCDKNFFVYTVDELQTVYVPILKDSVKKLRLDDFSFYEQDKVSRKLMAFFTKLNTDGTLQRVLLFFRDAYQPVYNAFVLDQGSWVSFSLLPDEESYLWDLVLKATGKTLFPVN
ncbi:hypothetical protein TpMuguga_02g00760 [Theileria parva strain Muguga]|uniref:Uncharacterized protein n=1 Tax=Theileria parva TaxID=5875 RepID=Q4N479_THEPA|nr:uncharacterized protein TpMuguga_02g00760 [Theileria parva strain Muguga]EAN33044.1 hypothetical protein TpMuguga_02g00760 [Theileria parva strain Muguga]|eukprot:XP_765327.1 hypothetical protein [Theileria parva strain Muguga]